jgi:hypothetical protein
MKKIMYFAVVSSTCRVKGRIIALYLVKLNIVKVRRDEDMDVV